MGRLLKVCLSPPSTKNWNLKNSAGLSGCRDRGNERHLRFCMSQNQNIYGSFWPRTAKIHLILVYRESEGSRRVWKLRKRVLCHHLSRAITSRRETFVQIYTVQNWRPLWSVSCSKLGAMITVWPPVPCQPQQYVWFISLAGHNQPGPKSLWVIFSEPTNVS